MSKTFEAARISDHVYWVGAIDWDVRNFHGYRTGRGTTYNAFLVMADKVTLIDTVKAPFESEMFARIASVVEPTQIDYIVSNHSEMDHSGCLPHAIRAIRPEKVFASKMGRKALAGHFHTDDEITVVGDGDSLHLGNATLSFAETRMCHWPDSMVSYLHEDELLFSQDAFGMHLASAERFTDEIDAWILDSEAAKYYANILLPLSGFVQKTLDKVAALNLPVSILAPDHGPIRRKAEDIEGIISCYARWAAQRPAKKAVLVYDTMWGSTAEMARAIGEGLASGGAKAQLMSMSSRHRSDVAAELQGAGALIVGSPTINNGIFPTIADVMAYIKGLKPQHLTGAAFGSYGWSGEAPRLLDAMLRETAVETAAEPLRINWVPDEAALAECRRLGETVAATLKERCGD